jgi:hypothetical protein
LGELPVGSSKISKCQWHPPSFLQNGPVYSIYKEIYIYNGDGAKACTPSVHIKMAGLKWMFIPIGIDP